VPAHGDELLQLSGESVLPLGCEINDLVLHASASSGPAEYRWPRVPAEVVAPAHPFFEKRCVGSILSALPGPAYI
jgi:hypothetical protein